MKSRITKTEKLSENDILNFVVSHIKKFHVPPTLEEIALFIGLRTARREVAKLVKQGYIEKGMIHEQKQKKNKQKKHAG